MPGAARAALPLLALLLAAAPAVAAADDPFAPLDTLLPPASAVRTATGRPGPGYWQQKVDYAIEVTLDQPRHSIAGTARIAYTNNSPEPIDALWLAAGDAGFDPEAPEQAAHTLIADKAGTPQLRSWELAWDQAKRADPGLFKVAAVRDGEGHPIAFEQRGGLLRIPLPRPLGHGEIAHVAIDWSLVLGDFHHVFERAGYEYFPATHDYQFSVGHWFPRVLAFTDYDGWATEPFLGEGEFSAEFGDYDVAITVPADHVVAATGVLANPGEVLSATQRARLERARGSTGAIAIITPEEALANARHPAAGTRTWRFHAAMVRDFAWASSPRFAWDAAGFDQPGAAEPHVLAMSLYPYPAAALWARQSTALVRHTLAVYGAHAFAYPYPVLTSVNAFSQDTGVEYPMLGFTGPRPVYDPATATAQYSRIARDGLAELVIHESGHNWFPEIVNSDERRYGWMDEGLNTFLNHLAALEWRDTPGALFGRPLAPLFERALAADPRRPLMTMADDTPNYFATDYFKAAGALVLLREQVLGRETFDRALAAYARRWAFKRPTPADFFRTIDDVSGRKLGWFWRGWFYGTDSYDMAITKVVRFGDVAPPPPRPSVPAPRPADPAPPPDPLTLRGNRAAGIGFAADADPALADYYSREPAALGPAALSPPPPGDGWFDRTLAAARAALPWRYGIALANRGGLLLPLTLRIDYADGSHEDRALPVEIWRENPGQAIVPMYLDRQAIRFTLDPDHATPDGDRANDVASAPFATVAMQPLRAERDERGEMGAAGVAVTLDGRIVRKR